jgi:hypothetical protein
LQVVQMVLWRTQTPQRHIPYLSNRCQHWQRSRLNNMMWLGELICLSILPDRALIEWWLGLWTSAFMTAVQGNFLLFFCHFEKEDVHHLLKYVME